MPTKRPLPLNERGCTRTVKAVSARDAGPLRSRASALAPRCSSAPAATCQEPPELLHPLWLPSSKLSENRVAAPAPVASTTDVVATASAIPAALSSRRREVMDIMGSPQIRPTPAPAETVAGTSAALSRRYE
jgi:hypothetical protein